MTRPLRKPFSSLVVMMALSATVVPPTVRAQSGGGGAATPRHLVHNAIYVEAGGNCWPFSLNYERRFTDELCLRVGTGLYVTDTGAYPNNASFYVPTGVVMGSYLFGYGSSKFEFGVGMMLQFGSLACEYYSPPLSCDAIKPTLSLGYRYEARDGGILFRAGLTPVWFESGVYWGAGLSVGWGF